MMKSVIMKSKRLKKKHLLKIHKKNKLIRNHKNQKKSANSNLKNLLIKKKAEEETKNLKNLFKKRKNKQIMMMKRMKEKKIFKNCGYQDKSILSQLM